MILIGRNIIIALSLLFVATGAAADVSSEWQVDQYAKTRLVLEEITADHVKIGLEIVMEDGWHTYWRAPGDAGLPPNFDWAGSVGVDDDNVVVGWPWPIEFRDFDYQTFGYEGRVILPITVPLAASLVDSQAQINLKLNYGVCDEVCIPLSAQLSLPIGSSDQPATDLTQWRDRVPDKADTLIVEAAYDGSELVIDVPGAHGHEMIADTDDGRIFYANALDDDGQARFMFAPSALNPDPTGQKIRIAVVGADGVRSVVKEATVMQSPPAQNALTQDPK